MREVDSAILGDVFYKWLFSQYPALRSMFKSTMRLNMIVARFDRPDSITPEIRQLARTHESYEVKSEQYVVDQEALLWTLEQGLGND